jgi:DNA helicase II / ATP-dependent DNA helicase PcrA
MTDLLNDLNEPQREAVAHIDGPLLVLAGAGSGKTRVITRRVAYLIAQGIDPQAVLAITFTNKAAEELRQRVEALGTAPGATLCTFHSLCARLLRQYADRAGLHPSYTIYDRDDQLKVAKQAIEDCNLPRSYLTPARAHGAISNAKNDLLTPQAYAEQAGEFDARNLADIYARYEQLLAENNALDFDDLLMRMAFLLRDDNDLRQHLGLRFQYLLIDEYQDTNRAQYLIAHAIALDHENLCATGDPDQSIYAWRGADISNILDFEKDYPDTRVIRLEENYRSVQPILNAAGALIDHNTMRKSKRLFTSKPGGGPVRVLTTDDEHAEARQIAKRIEHYRAAGGAYGDVAVFYRVNSLSRVIEEALLRLGIPYRIARGVEFYNRKAIKDVLAYLRLLVNPADDIACARIINTPTRGIGATTVNRMQIWAAANETSLLDAARRVHEVELSAGPTKKASAFAGMMADLAADLDRPVRRILEDIYRQTGLEATHSKSDEDSRDVRSNVEELINAAAEFDEEDHENPVLDYLQQISLVSDADHYDSDAGVVSLMTLHAAKGLEFPVVFIMGCEEGLLPFQRDTGPDGEDLKKVEEERRLAFVGMTRAKHALTLSSARMRRVRGMQTPQQASRFLHELGQADVEREDLTTAPAKPRRFRGGFYGEDDEPAGLREAIERFPLSARKQGIAFDEDFADDDETPIPPEYEYIRPGCTVRHAKFGLGKIVKLSQPWPNTRADVQFHEFGRKRLVLAHASLDVLDGGD